MRHKFQNWIEARTSDKKKKITMLEDDVTQRCE